MLLDQLQSDLKSSMLAKQEVKTSTLRMLISEIKNFQIQKGELNDQDIVSVVQKEAKKRKEAIQSFRSGGREEMAQKEKQELKILESYLPQQLPDEELTKIVDTVINEVGAKSMTDMGKVISQVMARVGQSADGGRVSQIVRQKLAI